MDTVKILESRNPDLSRKLVCSQCRNWIEYSVDKNVPETITTYEVRCYICGTHNIVAVNSTTKSNNSKSSSYSNMKSGFYGKTGTDEKPLETDYYDILEISPTATQNEIKKAYRIKALKYHPDKNLNDAEAGEMFKKIAEAYQILSDPDRRASYNRYGKSDNNDIIMSDPAEFFKQQFGGDKFSDLIGDISIFNELSNAANSQNAENNASATSDITSPPKESEEDIKRRQEEREKRVKVLSEKLIERLSTYTHSFPLDESTNKAMNVDIKQVSDNAMSILRDIMKAETEELKKENYGVPILQTIGYTYILKAQQALAQYDVENGKIHRKIFGYTSKFSGYMKEKSHIFSETVGTLKTAIDLQTSFNKLQEAEKNEGLLSPEEQELRNKLEFEAANKGMETVWRGSKLDIESVLREVCDNVLYDSMATAELKHRRAKALLTIGEVFSSVKA